MTLWGQDVWMYLGFPDVTNNKESACQCRGPKRCRFDPWVMKIPWSRKWQPMVFPVVMYRCESWTIKKAKCQRIDAFELSYSRRLLRVPWTAKRPDNPKGNQPYILIGRTTAKAEAPILWPPDVKSQLIIKDLDARKNWRKEKGTIEDEMVGWYHQLNGHEFEQTPGDSEGQGSLACCNSWGQKESDTTWRLKNNNAC